MASRGEARKMVEEEGKCAWRRVCGIRGLCLAAAAVAYVRLAAGSLGA